MNEILLVVGMSAVTFVTRYPVLAWLSRSQLPPGIFRALRYVPPAVLSAIIFPAVLLPEGKLALGLENAFLAAGIISALIAWRTRNLLLTIVLGMAALWVWRGLIGS